MPPTEPQRRTVAIRTDGAVTLTLEWLDGRRTTEELSHLSTNVTERLRELVHKVRPGQMRDADPSRQPCVDAPSTVYLASPSFDTNPEVMLAQFMNCKQYYKENMTQDEMNVRRALDSALSLAEALGGK
jgi:hypothetical protein